MQAEHFDDKLASFFAVWGTVRFTLPGPYTRSMPWQADDDLVFLAAGDSGGFAGGVAAWSVKYYTKSVRPLNVFQNLFVGQNVTAWGGPYQGTKVVKGENVQTYLLQQGHPSYPSGTTCFTEAMVAAFRYVLGGIDVLPQPIVMNFTAGSSKIEPAIPALFGYPGQIGTPASDISLVYPTLSSYAFSAGESRLDCGVHFEADVAASRAQCPPVGIAVAQNILKYLHGEITTVLNPNNRDHFSASDPLKLIYWFDKPMP